MFKNTSLRDILVETLNCEYYLIPDKDDIFNNLGEFQTWLYKVMGK